jgi:hypothetical protein
VLEGSISGTGHDEESYNSDQPSQSSPVPSHTARRANGKGSKLADLLDGLETCVLSPLQNLPAQIHPPPQSMAISLREAGATELTGEDVSMRSVSQAQGILEPLQRLDRLEDRTLGLSVATNFAYWRLGVNYERFCEVRSIP